MAPKHRGMRYRITRDFDNLEIDGTEDSLTGCLAGVTCLPVGFIATCKHAGPPWHSASLLIAEPRPPPPDNV